MLPNELNFYLEHLIECCGLDSTQVFDGVKRHQDLDALSLQQIANNLQVHYTHLLYQSVDANYLKSIHCAQSCNDLPKRFKHGAYSSTTSLKSVLDEFIEYEKYQDALMYLQINPKHLCEHKKMSITIIFDLIQFLSRYIDDKSLTNIAQRNADAFLATDFFGDVFFDCLDNKKPGESLFENIHLIERNWTYDIEQSNNGKMLIHTSQTAEMLDHCPNENYTDKNTIKIRFEFIKRVLEKVGYQSQIKQLKTPSERGEFTFEIEYKKIKRPFWKKQVFALQ